MEIKVIDTDLDPRCQHCNLEMKHVLRRTDGTLEVHVIYMCPNCRKVLAVGFSHDR